MIPKKEMHPIKFQVLFTSRLTLFPIMSLGSRIGSFFVKGPIVLRDAYHGRNVKAKEVNSIKEDAICVWRDQLFRLEFVDQDADKINFGF